MKPVNGISRVLAIAITLSLFAALPAIAQKPAEGVVRVIGADSMAHTVTIYANEFSAIKPNCNILVSGGPSRGGWEKLVNGVAEIAMMSSLPSKSQQDEAKTKGLNVTEAVIAWGGIVIITHPSNPVDSLTVDQVRLLLSGRVNNWKDVGGPDRAVTVVSVADGVRSGSARFLAQDFVKGSIAPGARLLAYFRSVPPTVAETEGSIGVIRMRNLERLIEQGQDKRIKVMGIKKDERSPAVTPSRESIDEGTYPITRPYFLCITSKADKDSMDFFKFCEARNPRPKAAELSSRNKK